MLFNSTGIERCEFLVKYIFIEGFSSTLDFYINGVFLEADIIDYDGLYTAKLVYDNRLLRSELILLEFRTDVVQSSEVDLRNRGLIISNISIDSMELF